uniref:Methyltransferase n=1 Tax=viral metagenome TaxID=1070528 RepID=A0A6C0C4M4_9ZZZZ
MNDVYLRKQIITYMGNKRKFISIIGQIIDDIKTELNADNLVLADGFSGSGIISRLLKVKGDSLYVNDIAGYSETLNKCYLSSPSPQRQKKINTLIEEANNFAHSKSSCKYKKWIQLHWAPSGKITKGQRVYYTEQNGKLIDRYRTFINSLSEKDKPFILAPLLVEASIHNNTNGQFSAFYKDESGVGKYGGKKEIDVKRITTPIKLPMPLFSPSNCNVNVSRMDTNQWVRKIPEVDMVYYDPPYNKHPYSIYFFMLDIINDWKTEQNIPDTNRGQPKTWFKSPYNSFTNAKKAFEDLIKHTRSKFILLSYNNGGIIPLSELESILGKYGKLMKIPVEHKTYHKLQGIASYKRKKEYEDVKEFLWLLDCRDKK